MLNIDSNGLQLQLFYFEKLFERTVLVGRQLHRCTILVFSLPSTPFFFLHLRALQFLSRVCRQLSFECKLKRHFTLIANSLLLFHANLGSRTPPPSTSERLRWSVRVSAQPVECYVHDRLFFPHSPRERGVGRHRNENPCRLRHSGSETPGPR